MSQPVDLLLVGGLNDLLRSRTPSEILADIQHFKCEVNNIPGSSFAVATLPMPPKISVLASDDHNLSDDLTRDLIELNSSIRQLNLEDSQGKNVCLAPTFHTWGLRSSRRPSKGVGPRNLLENLPSHLPGDWREEAPEDQLHLSDKVRNRMGKSCVKYFMSINQD